MIITKRDHWTEFEVLLLPAGEHDYFERKAGALLSNKDFEKDMAKAISALANSGGGYLIFGQKDDGSFDGLPEKQGRTPIREWLEQKIPFLVSYSLQDFRVHTVETDTLSQIPANTVVVVIEISDSSLAPHQSVKDNLYYHRVGGHSKPAPHFYLETLRGRTRFPNAVIVEVWFETVINPMLSELSNQHEILSRKGWTYNQKSQRVEEVISLNSEKTQFNISGNEEQFLEMYPDINDAFHQREQAFVSLEECLKEFYKTIRESPALYYQFEKFTTTEAYQPVRELIKDSYKKSLPDEKLRQDLFYGTDEQFLDWLAEAIVNKLGKINNNFSTEPFWNTYRENFLSLLYSTEAGSCESRIEQSTETLLKTGLSLSVELEETRKQLSRQHGVPYYRPRKHELNLGLSNFFRQF